MGWAQIVKFIMSRYTDEEMFISKHDLHGMLNGKSTDQISFDLEMSNLLAKTNVPFNPLNGFNPQFGIHWSSGIF